MKREKVINSILEYFGTMKVDTMQFEIVGVGFLEDVENITVYITAKKVGLLIGKKGWRIKEMEGFMSKELKTVVDLQVIEHRDWWVLDNQTKILDKGEEFKEFFSRYVSGSNIKDDRKESSKMDWKKFGD